VAEGAKVLGEALAAGAAVESVFYAPGTERSPSDDAVLEQAHARGVRVFPLAPGVLERIADTVSPQGVLGVVAAIDTGIEALGAIDLVVVLEDVRDPGNVGAIVRSADASGADAVICLSGTADLYNPKVVRASAGSLFHLPIVTEADPDRVIEFLHRRGSALLATGREGGLDYALDPWPEATALVLGNEANGVSGAMRDRCDGAISIPIAGAAESLNVAMAATVLLFEAARRRRTPAGR
jgi:TrmH family RNA methyltransferase